MPFWVTQCLLIEKKSYFIKLNYFYNTMKWRKDKVCASTTQNQINNKFIKKEEEKKIYLPNLHDQGECRKVRTAADCIVFIRECNPAAFLWPAHRLSFYSFCGFPVNTTDCSCFWYFLKKQRRNIKSLYPSALIDVELRFCSCTFLW